MDVLGPNGILNGHLRILSWKICTTERELAKCHALGFLQRLSIPPVPLASRFLPRLCFKGLDVAHCNGLFPDPTHRSPRSHITVISGVRLPLSC